MPIALGGRQVLQRAVLIFQCFATGLNARQAYDWIRSGISSNDEDTEPDQHALYKVKEVYTQVRNAITNMYVRQMCTSSNARLVSGTV